MCLCVFVCIFVCMCVFVCVCVYLCACVHSSIKELISEKSAPRWELLSPPVRQALPVPVLPPSGAWELHTTW